MIVHMSTSNSLGGVRDFGGFLLLYGCGDWHLCADTMTTYHVRNMG